MPERSYYIYEPNTIKGFRQVDENEWRARPTNVAVQPLPTKTCKVIIKNCGQAALNGYAASVYKEGKFYCNYIMPSHRNYDILEIEDVVCGSMLILYAYNFDGIILQFKGAEPLEDIAINGNTYFFKVVDCDTEIEVE